MSQQPKMPVVRVTPEQAQQLNKSLRPMKQFRTALYDMFHARVIYWPPRAVLRQFKRRP